MLAHISRVYTAKESKDAKTDDAKAPRGPLLKATMDLPDHLKPKDGGSKGPEKGDDGSLAAQQAALRKKTEQDHISLPKIVMGFLQQILLD